MDSGREVLMILKTPWARVAALEKLVLTKHPYDTPEFLAAKIERGNRRYLSWIEASVRR
jgi:periplasmic divalent cation tolerance protein